MKNTKYRVLADADLILEFFINRDKYIEDVEIFMNMIDSSVFNVFITDKCSKRLCLDTDDESIANEAMNCIGRIFKGYIIEINQQIREEARRLDIMDFDSAEECVCASIHNIDAIITLNRHNFEGAFIPILSIKDLLVREKLRHTVTLNVPTSLQKFTNGQGLLSLSSCLDVRGFIEQLEEVCPGIKARLCDDSGQMRRFLNLYVNDEDIRFLDGMDTPISDGDRIAIVPAVAGG
jgi:sulfur-carrier protein